MTMLPIIKLIIFFLIISLFAFTVLSQILKIRSLILLTPFSIIFGISSFIFTCHSLSFFIGPQKASTFTLVLLLISTLLILLKKRKGLITLELETDKSSCLITLIIAFVISFLTYEAVSKYGTFDRDSHMPMAMTMFHNNSYPPRDCFRPDYVLLYHYGGDLLAGAIQFLTDFDISTSYESVATILSSTMFLSLIALCWILTNNFKVSLLGGFCAYFGGGLLWLDAIIRFLTKDFPEGANWSFFETFLNLGIHGSINNAPSVLSFISTFNLGNPLLVFILGIFWKMLEGKSIKATIPYIICLSSALFTLFLTADWLFATFWGAVLPFLIVLWFIKKKQFILPTIILLIVSLLLSKTIGNALFLQDQIQNLGRTNIFDIGIKENLFTVVGWGKLTPHVMNYQEISCFSWDFIAEMGLGIFLSYFAIRYLLKTKKYFGYLLFLSALMTMPTPVLLDFKMNPVELVRLFGFGNTILILLITCSIAYLYKPFLSKGCLITPYIIVFCLSPISQLLAGAIFSPYVYYNKALVHSIQENLRNSSSIKNIAFSFNELNKNFSIIKNHIPDQYINEIRFLKLNSNPGDVALSSEFRVPPYAGVYSLMPARKLIYWEQLYSPFNTLFETTFRTLDPYLLYELNIKWLLVDKEFKSRLSKETQDFLNTSEIFKLKYISPSGVEIYHINLNNALLKTFLRKTAWILINKQGSPIGLENKIILFSSIKKSLEHLKSLSNANSITKKELITAQAIEIQAIETQIKNNNININLEKRF